MNLALLLLPLACTDGSLLSLDNPPPADPDPQPPGRHVACATDLGESLLPSGTNTLASHPERDLLYVLNEAVESLSRIDLATGDATTLDLDGRPGRIARIADRVYVTLRSERTLLVLQESGTGLAEVDRVEVGHEPLGVVVHPSQDWLFVALSGSNAVVELSVADLSERHRWSVEGEPRWLAAHPEGCDLYVSSARGGLLTHIALADGGQRKVPMPQVQRSDDIVASLTPRFTGDMDISPDGRTLLVPGMWVDVDTVEGRESTTAYYAPAPADWSVSRFNPIVARVPLEWGAPGEDIDALYLAGDMREILDERFLAMMRSYPASVGFLDDGETALATFEAAETAVAFPHDADAARARGHEADAGISGAFTPPKVFISTCAGPRGVAIDADGERWVHCMLDQQVAPLDVDSVTAELAQTDPDWFYLSDGHTWAGEPLSTGAERLPAQLDQGRRLFYGALDERLTELGSGVSCATCHFDGRDDGLTWPLARGERQTPSLGGVVSETTPVTWSEGMGTVQGEALETSTTLMAGTGLDTGSLDALAAWVNATTAGDGDPHADEAAVALGAELFARSDVGCEVCHSGARFTDNEAHTVLGESTAYNTPTLQGVGMSAPYLHDGRIGTLESLVERAGELGMGDTSQLTDDERAGLVAFLRSL